MQPDDLIDALASFRADGLEALFLGGSHGRGTADAVSDVDLLAIVTPGTEAVVVARWRHWMEAHTQLVLWRAFGDPPGLINLITQSWLRCDLSVKHAGALARHAQDTLKPLHDPSDHHARLPARYVAPPLDLQKLGRDIEEFTRILGLTSVVMGRGETLVAQHGAILMRNLLVDMMMADGPPAPPGGLLHLSRSVTPEHYATLLELPGPEAVPDSHLAMADVYFPLARRVAARCDAPWPDDFIAATRAHLLSALGKTFGLPPEA